MINTLLKFLFPPKCPFCGKVLSLNALVCDDCFNSLPFTGEDVCSVCSKPLDTTLFSVCYNCRTMHPAFENAFIPLIYKEGVRHSILKFKDYSHPQYAEAFAFIISTKLLASPYYTAFDYITFVPQDTKARRLRGYNQSELLARKLGKILKTPVIPTLKRTNDGERQHTLSAAKRKENVKKCFVGTDAKFSGTVLLIDDIYTTGATASYCSKLLKKMGFKKVFFAAIATPYEEEEIYE